MRYLSQEELIKQKDKISDGPSKLFMHCLITMCKELPDQQWQTIDKFKANPIEGWCWISYSDRKNIDMAYYEDNGFYWNDMHNNTDNWNDVNITHVMPIKTPEAPK